MSEDNKEAYEVGIPLEDLPSQDPSVEEELENVLPNDESEAPADQSGLPDLFDPEELAEVGLTAELAESVDTGAGPANDGEADAPGLTALDLPTDQDENALDALTPDAADDGGDSDRRMSEPAEDAEPMEALAGAETDADTPFEQDRAGMEASIDVEADDENPSALIEREEVETMTAGEVEPIPDTDAGGFIDQDLLVGRLESLSLQIGELQREFEGKLKYDTHKDEIIDRLHSELQEYKQDIIKKYVLSIVMDVVKVADDIRKWLTYFRSLEVSQRDPRKLFRYLEAIPSDLEDVFYWHGVKPFSNQEGTFDPARQRAIKKVPTDDPALDKSVAHSIRPGYEWETKVIRQEMVAVYVYQEEQESTNTGMIDE